MEELASYQNGNTLVRILFDGTKIREYEDVPVIHHPESIDVKITDYCDMGCAYCHESSTVKGRHADLNTLLHILSELPSGVELAIGGGNPLSHPEIIPFLLELKKKGIIANITINQGHLKVYSEMIQHLIGDDLIKGIGVSVTSNNFKYVPESPNVVYHVIAGVNDISLLDKLAGAKVLVLGFKQFGFGAEYYSSEVAAGIARWRKRLHRYLGHLTLSFDNLAIEQLNVRRLFTKEGWEQFYMGDDFQFTMYIDAVKEQYAPTSRSGDRKFFSDYTLLEYFQKYRTS